MNSGYQRGDVWLINFDPVIGHEQGGQRPGLIISVDAFNASAGYDLFAIPITSKFRPIRSRVTIRTPEGGLALDSFIVCEKTRSLSKERLKKKIGRVSEGTLLEVEAILKRILGL